MKKISAFILMLVFVLTLSLSTFSVSAVDYGCDLGTVSSNFYLINLDTGAVIYDKNSDEKVPPASLTKIMTYIVVCENIADIENTRITVTEEALAGLDPASSVMGLESYIGEDFSVKELLYGLMIPSGNDAALVLAHYIGNGSVEKFVDLMNQKAGQLGCSGTHYVNPHGLYDPTHYSTAYDISVIARYALEKPFFKEITSSVTYKVDKMSHPLETTNYLIDSDYPMYYYEYATGTKTGFTDEAGRCLVSTASKEGYNYLCVALGAEYSYTENVNYAMLDSRELYKWAFNMVSNVELLGATETLKQLPVKYVWGDKMVNAVSEDAVVALLPNNYDESLVTTQVEIPTYATAPVEKGEVFGTISVYYDGELVGTTNVVSDENIERDVLNYIAHQIIDFVVNNSIWLAIVLAILIVLIVVKINADRQRKKRKARYRYR